MASITPRLDAWLDNPMVTGYGFPPDPPLDPIEIEHCPRCRAQWMKMPESMAENIMRPWEMQQHNGVWVTAPDHPIGHQYCRACAISAATCKDLIAYIEEHKLQHEALEYELIIGDEWQQKLDPVWAPLLWDAMKVKLYEIGRLRDYIEDMHPEPFVDWMMERSR